LRGKGALPTARVAFTRAITRRPARNFADGLTSADLGRPEFARMIEQHGAYVRALESLGLQVALLDPLEDHPDGHFVEDAAVVLPGVAVITRPGAKSRRGEERAMAAVLADFKRTVAIEAPGTLDGGDVLLAGRRAFVGLSSRTNEEGARQLGAVLSAEGYEWHTVPVGAGLHLKSSVNHLGGNALALTEDFAALEQFAGFDHVVVDAEEVYAANTLWINGTLLTPAGYPRTRRRLEALGLPIVELEMGEVRKMDGGLTCLSLRF
jgi:dimethylargininase